MMRQGLPAKAGVKTFAYVSSLGVDGITKGRSPYVDETAPYDERAVDQGENALSIVAGVCRNNS
jgi:hypothetical protein